MLAAQPTFKLYETIFNSTSSTRASASISGSRNVSYACENRIRNSILPVEASHQRILAEEAQAASLGRVIWTLPHATVTPSLI